MAKKRSGPVERLSGLDGLGTLLHGSRTAGGSGPSPSGGLQAPRRAGPPPAPRPGPQGPAATHPGGLGAAAAPANAGTSYGAQSIPIRTALAQRVKAGLPDCHPGLAFDKFLHTWRRPGGGWTLSAEKGRDGASPKADFFLEFAKRHNQRSEAHPLRELFSSHQQRTGQRLEALGATIWTMKTRWRLVTGLGIDHPTETGFVFHHTLGVPYLPGSAIKGAALDWAETDAWKNKHGDTVTEVFGTERKAGNVIFFDAFPTKWPQLDVDIMNPHYGPYYQHGEAPGDWHSPVPVFFLAVAAMQEFDFAVAVRSGVSDPNDALKHAARDAVTNAARELGLGGKSGVGYGYFD